MIYKLKVHDDQFSFSQGQIEIKSNVNVANVCLAKGCILLTKCTF